MIFPGSDDNKAKFMKNLDEKTLRSSALDSTQPPRLDLVLVSPIRLPNRYTDTQYCSVTFIPSANPQGVELKA
jgi:hypothetical protein